MKNSILLFILTIFQLTHSVLAQDINEAESAKPERQSEYITAGEYNTFLNSVALTDPHYLYDEKMATDSEAGCILRIGLPGNYSYKVIEGKENIAMRLLSWFDKARYCNWLENASFTNIENPDIIEHGVYQLKGGQINSINTDATYYVIQANDSCDQLLQSNQVNFSIVNTATKVALAEKSGGSNLGSSWSKILEGMTFVAAVLFEGRGNVISRDVVQQARGTVRENISLRPNASMAIRESSTPARFNFIKTSSGIITSGNTELSKFNNTKRAFTIYNRTFDFDKELKESSSKDIKLAIERVSRKNNSIISIYQRSDACLNNATHYWSECSTLANNKDVAMILMKKSEEWAQDPNIKRNLRKFKKYVPHKAVVRVISFCIQIKTLGWVQPIIRYLDLDEEVVSILNSAVFSVMNKHVTNGEDNFWELIEKNPQIIIDQIIDLLNAKKWEQFNGTCKNAIASKVAADKEGQNLEKNEQETAEAFIKDKKKLPGSRFAWANRIATFELASNDYLKKLQEQNAKAGEEYLTAKDNFEQKDLKLKKVRENTKSAKERITIFQKQNKEKISHTDAELAITELILAENNLREMKVAEHAADLEYMNAKGVMEVAKIKAGETDRLKKRVEAIQKIDKEAWTTSFPGEDVQVALTYLKKWKEQKNLQPQTPNEKINSNAFLYLIDLRWQPCDKALEVFNKDPIRSNLQAVHNELNIFSRELKSFGSDDLVSRELKSFGSDDVGTRKQVYNHLVDTINSTQKIVDIRMNNTNNKIISIFIRSTGAFVGSFIFVIADIKVFSIGVLAGGIGMMGSIVAYPANLIFNSFFRNVNKLAMSARTSANKANNTCYSVYSTNADSARKIANQVADFAEKIRNMKF